MTPLPKENLKWLLLQATLPTKQILLKIAERHGLSMMQLWTLSLSEPGKEVPMNTISHTLGCDASNVTGIVDRLLSMALIERHECLQDRRIKMISLTLKGQELRAKLFEELDAAPVENLDRLSPEEQKKLHELLIKTVPKEKVKE